MVRFYPRCGLQLQRGQIGKFERLKSVRIGKCQNCKVSELESVRIGKCQNLKVSELKSARFFWSLNIPYKWAKLCLSSNLSICHVPIEVSYAMVCITMVTKASFTPYLRNLKILTLSILTLSDSDTFHSDTFRFWHFQFSSNMGKIGFWHFPILTLSNPPSISEALTSSYQAFFLLYLYEAFKVVVYYKIKSPFFVCFRTNWYLLSGNGRRMKVKDWNELLAVCRSEPKCFSPSWALLHYHKQRKLNKRQETFFQ